jgi:opacity protein-like surface antigen
MRKPIISFSLLAIALTAGSAHAADVIYQEPAPAPIAVEPAASAFYIAGRIGAAFPRDTEFGVLGTTVVNDYESAGLNGSIAFGGDLGVFGFPLRAEIEGGYTSASVDSHTVVGIGTLSGDAAFGSTRTIYGLVNAYVDFGDGPLKPYVGGGIGAAHVDFRNHGVVVPAGIGLPVGPLTAMDDSGTGFAWQVGAGISYDLTSNLTAELGYRYFNVENVGLTAADGTGSDVDVRSHQINLGLRVSF